MICSLDREMDESKLIDGKGPVGPLKRLEHGVKWLAFGLLRLFLRRGRPPKGPVSLGVASKILLIRADTKLGDMILSLPLANLLKRTVPEVEMHLLCSPQCASIVRNDPRFSGVHLYRKRLFSDIATVATLRRQEFDVVIDLQLDDSITALLLSQWCSKAALRLGAEKTHYARYYDSVCEAPRGGDQHCIDTTLSLAEPLGMKIEDEDGCAGPFLTDKQTALAEKFASQVRGDDGRSALVGLNISAGSATRIWPTARLKELVDGLMSELPTAQIVIVCTPSDRGRATELAGTCESRVQLLPDGLSFLGASAIVRKLDLLISPDTSLVHVARSFRVPVVAMYPAHQLNLAKYHPYRQRDSVVVSGNIRDIQDISVSDVIAKVRQVSAQLEPQEAK
jgi:ADP-heptose:LPS heptosyltransferase